MDIYEQLKKDHEKQRTLGDIISKTSGDSDGRNDLWARYKKELEAHAAAEEQVFYAALIAKPKATDKARHSIAEHKEANDLMEQLDETDMSSSGWLATFKKLNDRIQHHVDEEENEVFPLARNIIDPKEAEAMAKDFVHRKEAEAGN